MLLQESNIFSSKYIINETILLQVYLYFILKIKKPKSHILMYVTCHKETIWNVFLALVLAQLIATI